MDINSQHHNLLWKPNFAQIGGFLYFGDHFGFKMATIANQNGRYMGQHVLLPVNIHFHWNLLIFEFLTIFLIFILAAILKILKTKSTTLSDNLFLCQVSKGSAVQFVFIIFCTLVTMATAAILHFLNPKSCHTLRWIFLQSFMKFDERNQKFFLILPFLFLWQLQQSLSNRFHLFWLISFH